MRAAPPCVRGERRGSLAAVCARRVEEAGALRAKMQAAIDAQDMEAAYRTEKELKQLMMEYGIRFEAEGREDS